MASVNYHKAAAERHPYLYWCVGGGGLLLSMGVMMYGVATETPIAGAGCLLAVVTGGFIRWLSGPVSGL